MEDSLVDMTYWHDLNLEDFRFFDCIGQEETSTLPNGDPVLLDWLCPLEKQEETMIVGTQELQIIPLTMVRKSTC